MFEKYLIYERDGRPSSQWAPQKAGLGKPAMTKWLFCGRHSTRSPFNCKMPSKSLTSNQHFSTIIILLIALALFPGLLQYLIALPFRLLFSSASSAPNLPSISCPIGCTPTVSNMAWFQKTFTLPSKSRGSYLVTDEVVKALPELKEYKVGLLNLFVQHTSCALSLNENWDSDVREDMSDALDRIAPEDKKGNLYRHSAEGLDDMPVVLTSLFVSVC